MILWRVGVRESMIDSSGVRGVTVGVGVIQGNEIVGFGGCTQKVGVRHPIHPAESF